MPIYVHICCPSKGTATGQPGGAACDARGVPQPAAQLSMPTQPILVHCVGYLSNTSAGELVTKKRSKRSLLCIPMRPDRYMASRSVAMRAAASRWAAGRAAECRTRWGLGGHTRRAIGERRPPTRRRRTAAGVGLICPGRGPATTAASRRHKTLSRTRRSTRLECSTRQVAPAAEAVLPSAWPVA